MTIKMFDANIIKNNKIYFDLDINVAEDAIFNTKLSKYIKKAFYLNEPLYYSRFNSSSAVRKFDDGYADKYLKSVKREKEYVRVIYNEKKQIELHNFIAYHLLLVVINYCFHPENKQKGIKLLKKVCNIPEYKEAVKYSKYKNFSLTRKITLFTLKYKLYILTSIIACVRQKQFKNRME